MIVTSREDQLAEYSLESVFVTRMIDQPKWEQLRKQGDGSNRELGTDNKIKCLEFSGNKDSIVGQAKFYFTYNGNKLLGYAIILDEKVAKVDEDTGEGQFYYSLVKKYGKPTQKIKYSKKWAGKGQSLYYTSISEKVIISYLSESNIGEFVKYINGLRKTQKTRNENRQDADVQGKF